MAVYQLGDPFVEEVVSKNGNARKRKFVLYECECGRLFVGRIERPAVSCGCLWKRPDNQRGCHRSWLKMQDRCLNRKHPHYDRYGGRGITICERWNDFKNFFEDMGPRPDGLTLERKNSHEGYHPGNCRWASISEQNRNKTNGTIVELDGVSMSVTEWSEQEGAVSRFLIFQRLERGWHPRDAIFGDKKK